ncbi:hypothetical protein NQ117_05145 [Paenibacillus sp. SC116]|uniref:hypothetical protein n=1 Tax=Paenibacillus sp. SC116 TaxID=2968986 RepID=UPI00215B76AF|nr:hypothetical protein [Paenibacillus sp. SC116]MCR8843058.1 hypothetical protein [Paenibacillus sp. SC116]
MVVAEPVLKERLLLISYGQQQVVVASNVIVVLGDLNVYMADNAEKINQRAIEAGNAIYNTAFEFK